MARARTRKLAELERLKDKVRRLLEKARKR
jgi:hypothetical protein